MARSFSNGKVVFDLISKAVARRGYSTATEAHSQGGVASKAAGPSSKAPKRVVKEKEVEKVSWVPDPVTGYYRPESVAEEIDVAELRAALLKKN